MTGVYTYYTQPIAETGCLRFKVTVPMAVIQAGTGTLTPGPVTALTVEMGIIACHIFASCDTQGSIWYSCFNEKRPLRNGNTIMQWSDGVNTDWPAAPTGPPFLTQDGNIQYGVVAEFDPRTYSLGFTATGKYIGTYFSFYGGPTSFNAATDVYANLGFWMAIGSPLFSISASDINVEGNTGPARIIRWDNLAPGMQVAVSGKMWIQSIPTNNIAPYVKAAIQGRNRWVDEDALSLISALLSGPGPMRRVWELPEYKKYIANDVDKIDVKFIAEMARRDDGVASALYKANFLPLMGLMMERTPADKGLQNTIESSGPMPDWTRNIPVRRGRE
jgi:hypothetical protein